MLGQHGLHTLHVGPYPCRVTLNCEKWTEDGGSGVCGPLSAHQELNDTRQEYRESTLHRFGPMGRKKVGDEQILPDSFSMLWTPLRYSLSLQIFWGKKSHMLSKHTCHVTCRVSRRPLGGSCGQHSEASYCILVPLSMPHFPFPLTLTALGWHRLKDICTCIPVEALCSR